MSSSLEVAPPALSHGAAPSTAPRTRKFPKYPLVIGSFHEETSLKGWLKAWEGKIHKEIDLDKYLTPNMSFTSQLRKVL